MHTAWHKVLTHTHTFIYHIQIHGLCSLRISAKRIYLLLEAILQVPQYENLNERVRNKQTC